MSQPTFPQIDPPLSREGSLNQIIASIAMEELSLSHILNAEGEKLHGPCSIAPWDKNALLSLLGNRLQWHSLAM